MLTVKNLSLKIDEKNIFRDVNFIAKEGEILLLKGKSGSGKSSILQVVSQIIPSVIDGEVQGEIILDNVNIIGMKVYDIAGKIGYMMQDPETQLCTFNVKDEILFGMENLCWTRETMKMRLNEVIKIFKLENLIHKSLTNLSGGQKQKVALASIVAINPDIYLLDEPTANLDPKTTLEIMEILNVLAHEYNKTIIIIEHKIHEISEYVDIIYDIETKKINTNNVRKNLDNYIKKFQLPSNSYKKSNKRILEVKNIEFSYGNKKILHNINLSLNKSEILALVGKNGAGKSTLSNIISGLRKADSGEVLINGQNIEKIKIAELGRVIGLVFQNPENQFVKYTVEDELAVGLIVRKEKINVVKDLVEKYLELFKLEEKRKNNPYQLSGGEKRKLSTACMLITGQKVLILDEPTYGQDRENLVNLMELLFEISKKGVGIIMISHDFEVISNSCHTIMELEEGRVIYYGEKDEYIKWKYSIKK